MNTIRFCFGVHNHQPAGNFESVFRESYERAYAPWIEVLERHDWFASSIHFSGALLEWILNHDLSVGDRLGRLVEQGRLEFLTGGYYEPVLIALPWDDRIGQIAKLSEFIESTFGTRPRGLWLTERVWEPHLPTTLAAAGVDYTILDDTHFNCGGLNDDALTGYFQTEDSGASIGVFPIRKRLRYTIPFAEPQATIDHLLGAAERAPGGVEVYADDGEKFGVWPDTFSHVWEDQWLARFMRTLGEFQDRIQCCTFADAYDNTPPVGRVHIPCASYAEMSKWSLPLGPGLEYDEFHSRLEAREEDGRFGIFARGGFWRNFLTKYDESNRLHKKAVWVSQLIDRWAEEPGTDPAEVARARDLLWRGQCNDPLWHGVFGGLYLVHLRDAGYESLIAAERIAQRGLRGGRFAEAELHDYDADGFDEAMLSSDRLGVIVSGAKGGSIVEWDAVEQGINLQNTMTRRPEIYHQKLRDLEARRRSGDELAQRVASIHDRVVAKEDDLDRYLCEDWHVRSSFLTHFFGPEASSEEFSQSDFLELGDFVNQPFALRVDEDGETVRAVATRKGGIWVEDQRCPLTVEKVYELRAGSDTLTCEQTVTNNWDQAVTLHMGVEMSFALQTDRDPDKLIVLASTGEEHALDEYGGTQDETGLTLCDRPRDFCVQARWNRPSTLWFFPLYTVSLSEDGFEKTYQQTVACPIWTFTLEPGERWTVGFTMSTMSVDDMARQRDNAKVAAVR